MTLFVIQPKYMQQLLKSAELRKKELERRTQKKVQKEREAEGDEFQDKEAFVTTAYKNKLQEMKEAEEKERLEQMMEGRHVMLVVVMD
jgi:coiled-coil domain-containing protein 55